MTRSFPLGFVAIVGMLHATMVALAGLGADISPGGAYAARWTVAAIHVGGVIYLAVRGGDEWVSMALFAPPVALALGLATGAVVMHAAWNARAGSPLVILAACALPAVAAALVAPALGALARAAVNPKPVADDHQT